MTPEELDAIRQRLSEHREAFCGALPHRPDICSECKALQQLVGGDTAALLAEVERLRGVLCFYADPHTWGNPADIDYDGGAISVDCGNKARAALEGK